MSEYKNTISILLAAQDEATAVIAAASDQIKAAQAEITASSDDMAAQLEAANTRIEESQTALTASSDEMRAAIVSANDEIAASTTAAMDEATAAVAAHGDAVDAMAVKSAAAGDITGEAAAGAAAGMSTGVGLTATAIAAATAVAAGVMVKAAGDFQASMTRLVTSAGESEDNLQMVSDGVLQIARDTGTSTTALAQAMYIVESGGQHGAAGLATLQAAAQGAKTENANLTTVADAVTSAMTDYHLSASQAADVTSKLVAATGQGKTTFEDLSGAMSAILPKASAAGISLNEILGDLASMTLHGISAQQAAENMADSISHLQSPTQAMSKEMASLGLNSTVLSQNLGKTGLSGTIQEISKAIQDDMGTGSTAVILDMEQALQGLPQSVQDVSQEVINGTATWSQWNAATKDLPVTQRSQAQAFATLFNGMHTIGTEQMTGAQVMQTYSGAMNKAMGDSAGLNVALMLTGQNTGNTTRAIQAVSSATADASGNVKGWSDIQGNFNTKMSELKEGLGTTGIEIGEALLPPLTTLAGDVVKFLGPLDSFVSKNKDLTAGILLTIGGVSALVAVTWAAEKATSAVGNSFSLATGLAKKFALSVGLLDSTEGMGGIGGALGKITGGGSGVAAAAGEATGGAEALGARAATAGAEDAGLDLTTFLGSTMAATPVLETMAATLAGPVTLGLVGAGAAALGAAYIYKRLHDKTQDVSDTLDASINNSIDPYTQRMQLLTDSTAGVTIAQATQANGMPLVSQGINMVTVAATTQKNAQNDVNNTMTAYKTIQSQTAPINATANTAASNLASAQSAYNSALATYGANNPKTITALQNLQGAQNTYNGTVNAAIGQSLSLSLAQGYLRDAEGGLKTSTYDLTGLQDALNGKYNNGIPIVGGYSDKVTGVVGQLNNANTQIGIMLGSAASINSLYSPIQAMTTNLQLANEDIMHIQETVPSKGLQGGMTIQVGSGGAIQGGGLPGHALGTSYSGGGATALGENGPELVMGPTVANLSPGSQVLSAAETWSAFGANGKSLVINNLNVYNNVDAGLVVRQIGWQLANAT